MPTVHRFGNFRVVIYPNDHRPEHVHVFNSDGAVVVLLDAALSVREVLGMSRKDVTLVQKELLPQLEYLRGQWRKFHG